jgi:hypothetical protein
MPPESHHCARYNGQALEVLMQDSYNAKAHGGAYLRAGS